MFIERKIKKTLQCDPFPLCETWWWEYHGLGLVLLYLDQDSLSSFYSGIINSELEQRIQSVRRRWRNSGSCSKTMTLIILIVMLFGTGVCQLMNQSWGGWCCLLMLHWLVEAGEEAESDSRSLRSSDSSDSNGWTDSAKIINIILSVQTCWTC